MDKQTLLAVVKAAMEAAVAITKATPNVTDDKIALVAQLIVNQVLELFGASYGAELTEEEAAAIVDAAGKIKAACDGKDCDNTCGDT